MYKFEMTFVNPKKEEIVKYIFSKIPNFNPGGPQFYMMIIYMHKLDFKLKSVKYIKPLFKQQCILIN